MKKLKIALLAGGISSEREVSLSSGQQVYEALDKARYDIVRYDPKTDLPRLIKDAAHIDIALIILHGPYGEDGTVQGLLDLLHIPYQGSGVLGSSLAMNKAAAKRLLGDNRYRYVFELGLNTILDDIRDDLAQFGITYHLAVDGISLLLVLRGRHVLGRHSRPIEGDHRRLGIEGGNGYMGLVIQDELIVDLIRKDDQVVLQR